MSSIYDQYTFIDLCDGLADKIGLSELGEDLHLSHSDGRSDEQHEEIKDRLQQFYADKTANFSDFASGDPDFGIALATVFMINGVDLDAEFKLMALDCISQDMERVGRFKNKWDRVRILRNLTREIHRYKKDGHQFDWKSLVEKLPSRNNPVVGFAGEDEVCNLSSHSEQVPVEVKIGLDMKIPDFLITQQEVRNYVYDRLSSLYTDDDTLEFKVNVTSD